MRKRTQLGDVLRAIAAIRCGAACTEAELHELAARAFADAGIAYEHEVCLAPRCRIDFMSGSVGVEIKKKRPERARLLEQLSRYAACECVSELVVVAPRGINLPKTVGGKRVTMVALERLWGIWLP